MSKVPVTVLPPCQLEPWLLPRWWSWKTVRLTDTVSQQPPMDSLNKSLTSERRAQPPENIWTHFLQYNRKILQMLEWIYGCSKTCHWLYHLCVAYICAHGFIKCSKGYKEWILSWFWDRLSVSHDQFLILSVAPVAEQLLGAWIKSFGLTRIYIVHIVGVISLIKVPPEVSGADAKECNMERSSQVRNNNHPLFCTPLCPVPVNEHESDESSSNPD